MSRPVITHQLVFLLAREKLGRRSLAQRSGLSEMTVRLELERLRDEGLVAPVKSGVTLTDSGERRFRSLLAYVRALKELSLASLARDEVTLAALISQAERRPVWWYRDQAIREGATAMVMLRYAKEGWCFAHDMEAIGIQNPRDELVIEQAFPTRTQSDLLAIVTAPDRLRASLGLWSVITEVLSSVE